MSVFTESGISLQCSDCYAFLGAPEVPPRPTTEAKPTQPAPRRAATKKPEPARSFDVVKAAKARLREIERELKRMRKLETEASQLRRLLSAAERPLADVKPLRAKS